LEFHLVSHTHWDREWYRTAEEFRQRLADLIDELIADPPAEGQSFLLDGQAIVVEDYLAVRPDNRERLRGLLQGGRLEAGPWYVLADELIPSGEALVRNLLAGRHVLSAMGVSSPAVLYCPDSFGHPAALPTIAEGFQLPLIVLWRGYGGKRWPSGDVVRWRAPSGAEATVFHLPPDGYEFGSSLPVDAAEAGQRWTRMRDTLARRSTVGVSLIQNGADHHARQRSHREAIASLGAAVARGNDRFIPSSLSGFAQSLLHRAGSQTLSVVRGELRDSYGYTWTLQGTLSSRAHEKRMNAIAERTLRRAEGWCAVARLSRAPSRADHLRAAWKTLLEAHPHDTLCGTSIDEVAEVMELRLRSARRQGIALTTGAVNALLGHDVAVARASREEKGDRIVILNGVPFARGGVVFVEQVEKLADEPVGPGSGSGPRFADVARTRDDFKVPGGAQLISSRVHRHRIESPRHYPDNDIVRSRVIACYVRSQPGLSVQVVESLAAEPPPSPATLTKTGMESGPLRVSTRRGALRIETPDATVDDVVRLEDLVDAGDLYTPSVRGRAASAKLSQESVTHRGPLIAELSQEWTLAPSRKGPRSSSVSVAVRLTADSPLTEFRIRGVNRMKNHRLRIGIATGVADATVFADAAFGLVERAPIAVALEDREMEIPPATAPLHRYVSLFSKTHGATIHSDGLAEYEVDGDGVVWITLVRAVGQLSRNDLPERPGHAGWPEAVPGAQCLGPFGARIALQVHGLQTAATLDAIERESHRFLNPLRGVTIRSAIGSLRSAGGIGLSGTALAPSAIKESEDARGIVLRCVNLSDREQHGTWSLRSPIESAHFARLDESKLASIEVQEAGGRWVVPFIAPPRAVITVFIAPGP
jgi:alpha-mannosidase